ncbi:MAG: cell division protein FtsH [Anaerolineaceae bacterium]|nr:cell division protein FtsH [Anaerolineaceae bacterium]
MQFGPNNSGKKDPEGPRQQPPFKIPNWVWPAVWLLILLWLFFRVPGMVGDLGGDQPIDIPYSFFYEQVNAGRVSEVTLQDTTIRGRFTEAVTWPPSGSTAANSTPSRTSNRFTATLPPVEDPQLLETLRANNVEVTAQTTETSPILLFLLNFGPILLLLGFFFWSARRAQGQMGNVFGFGRSQAREYNAERPQVTFSDVAGQDNAKQELEEIVDFLKEPDKYVALGARIPRGVLLVGPPGTGKTLMARAVAGEANVAFFSLAASEFVEMFVGVGASRVRDLFKRAKENAPSIIFIDEIDAVGRRRGTGLGGGHDEREQTLNQLLAEMDGFDQNESVIIMAATNRADVLDPALLRPGRFDRQVTVGAPDRKGREAILKIHSKGKPLADDVKLDELAKATIGFSGADLANLANEAALHAARAARKRITMMDFTDAFERIVLGIKSPPLANEQERRLTAFHEAGHALVAALTPHADPLFKITIVPRGQALGVTTFLPDDDRRNYSRNQLIARIHVGLGGRAAEQIVLGEVSTGAMGDIRQVTNIARRMITQFGMSEKLGLVDLSHEDDQPFLGYSIQRNVPYSDDTLAMIDDEIKTMISDAYDHVLDLLQTNRDKLDKVAQELLDNEVVERVRVLEIAGIDPKEAEKASEQTDDRPAMLEPSIPDQPTEDNDAAPPSSLPE